MKRLVFIAMLMLVGSALLAQEGLPPEFPIAPPLIAAVPPNTGLVIVRSRDPALPTEEFASTQCMVKGFDTLCGQSIEILVRPNMVGSTWESLGVAYWQPNGEWQLIGCGGAFTLYEGQILVSLRVTNCTTGEWLMTVPVVVQIPETT